MEDNLCDLEFSDEFLHKAQKHNPQKKKIQIQSRYNSNLLLYERHSEK
jgi:hypothetical protein